MSKNTASIVILVHFREIFKEALRHRCISIIVVRNYLDSRHINHNKVNGSRRMGIELLEHVVISTDRYII